MTAADRQDTEPTATSLDPSDRTGDLRSFGRRRGRKLSVHQQRLLDEVLPRVAVDLGALSRATPQSLAGPDATETWLEIGFGGGEHLLWQAAHHPHVALIGCEPFEEGVVKVLAAIAAAPESGKEAGAPANIRLHADDARAVLRALPAASVDRAFVLFPDPWPKTRHRKRRLVSAGTVAALSRVLAPGAELRLATDIGDYAAQMLRVVLGSGAFAWTAERAADWRLRPADWPPTRYEAKALREGRRCAYLRFVRL